MHEIFKRIYTNYGVRGIYKGLTVTIVRDMPAFAVYFYVFSYLSEDVFNVSFVYYFILIIVYLFISTCCLTSPKFSMFVLFRYFKDI